jgi:hypothetical protein
MEMLEIVFLVVGGFRFMDLLDDVTLLYAGKKTGLLGIPSGKQT